jgi:hypothetical protein
MRPGRTALGVLLVVLAVVAALLAADLRSWQSGVQAGDVSFAKDPPSASWTASTTLPSDPALKVLGLSGQLALRRATQSFVAVQKAGRGIDNCYVECKARAALEGQLTALAAGANHLRDSQADNLLGILAYGDSRPGIPGQTPVPIDQSVGNFRAAVQLDPTNADAKYNLELLMQKLAPSRTKRTQNGPTNSTGPSQHSNQAGTQGQPGTGY